MAAASAVSGRATFSSKRSHTAAESPSVAKAEIAPATTRARARGDRRGGRGRPTGRARWRPARPRRGPRRTGPCAGAGPSGAPSRPRAGDPRHRVVEPRVAPGRPLDRAAGRERHAVEQIRPPPERAVEGARTRRGGAQRSNTRRSTMRRSGAAAWVRAEPPVHRDEAIDVGPHVAPRAPGRAALVRQGDLDAGRQRPGPCGRTRRTPARRRRGS